MQGDSTHVTLLVTQTLERRRMSVIATDPEQSVYVTSPEDVILSKLEWYRMGGEVVDRQWRDILGVLKTGAGELEPDYLCKWSEELKVTDLLERALAESNKLCAMRAWSADHEKRGKGVRLSNKKDPKGFRTLWGLCVCQNLNPLPC